MIPGVGCPIEDIQSREDSNEMHKKVETFIKIKGLSQGQGYSSFLEKQLSENGLHDLSLDDMIALEGVWCDYLSYRQKVNNNG